MTPAKDRLVTLEDIESFRAVLGTWQEWLTKDTVENFVFGGEKVSSPYYGVLSNLMVLAEQLLKERDVFKEVAISERARFLSDDWPDNLHVEEAGKFVQAEALRLMEEKDKKEGRGLKGTLDLVKSKNPPVFKFPLEIEYEEEPVVGGIFEFRCDEAPYCNLSLTRQLFKTNSGWKIITNNSIYTLKGERRD